MDGPSCHPRFIKSAPGVLSLDPKLRLRKIKAIHEQIQHPL
jgi:hypothetical protein